ncbi:MAG TPA: VCBS repeat-containing protein, partial [Gaiellaceae bacterium]|nr:VCBS repeat-containing protein [Gaiellaceae bacterium]
MIGALILAAAAAATAPPAAPPAPKAEVVKLDDGTRFDLAVDGPLLDWSVVRRGGRSLLLLLAGPADKKKESSTCSVEAIPAPAPRNDARLFAWDPSKPDALVPLEGALAEGMLDAVDLDGDGNDEVLLFAEAGIAELALDVEAKTATARTLAQGRYVPVERGASKTGIVRAVGLGALTTFRRTPEGALRPASEVELPVRVSPSPSRVRVRTRGVDAIGATADGRARFATAPEPIGVERLRTIVLDPDGPPDARSFEAWARFPSRERAMEHDLLRLDGRPVLVVLTTTADKLSLFGEKKLRVFPLEPDRTRMGVAPALALETGINLWQTASPTFTDLDGDGREDLVLAYWKGLSDTISALEVHKRNADGSLSSGSTFDFDVADGDRGFLDFGHDLDGDGRPDLVLRAAGALAVYPGAPKAQAIGKPVAKAPSRRVTLPA